MSYCPVVMSPNFLGFLIHFGKIHLQKTIIITPKQSLTVGTRVREHAGATLGLASIARRALATAVLVWCEHFAVGIADSLRRGLGRLRGTAAGATVGRRGLARGRAVVEGRRCGSTGAVRSAVVVGHEHHGRLGLTLCANTIAVSGKY